MKVKEDYLREIKERAEKALNKKAPLGPDVDLMILSLFFSGRSR